MTHVRRETRRPESALLEAFRGLDVATVYEASGRKGYIGNAVRPIAPGTRICGPGGAGGRPGRERRGRP
jgi:4-hydroxy-4-methyl-2-oxoglutarate aldolase